MEIANGLELRPPRSPARGGATVFNSPLQAPRLNGGAEKPEGHDQRQRRHLGQRHLHDGLPSRARLWAHANLEPRDADLVGERDHDRRNRSRVGIYNDLV